MKKTHLIIAGLLVVALVSCNNSGKTGSSLVTITVGSDKTASLSIQQATLYARLKNFLAAHLQMPSAMASIPSNVASLQITAWASDMPIITQTIDTRGLASASVTLVVPNGSNRLFAITGFDINANITYGGGMSADLSGAEVSLPIPMINLGTVGQILYVSTSGNDTTGDGSLQKPFRTISNALVSAATGSMGILVWPGTYNTAGGETFPLTLPINTALACIGPNHSTIIDVFGAGFDAIYGNTSARIDGCKIIPDYDWVGISDNTTPTIINNIVMDEGQAGFGPNPAIIIAANSSITNSIIENSISSGIDISSGNPVITGNTLTGHSIDILVGAGNAVISFNKITSPQTIDLTFTGISVTGGAPVISGNTIVQNSFGISVSGGSPTISGNKISNNSSEGIDLSGSIAPSAATISGNTIDHNGYGMYIFSAGTSSIHSNDLYCNSTVDLYLGDTTLSTVFDISNNAWDHDKTTLVSGPTFTSDAAGCPPGVDICYYNLIPPPNYQPYNAAVPGGCQ